MPTAGSVMATDRSDADVEITSSIEARPAISPTTASANPEANGTDYASLAAFFARFGFCGTRTYNARLRLLTIDKNNTHCLCPGGCCRHGHILVQFTTNDGSTRSYHQLKPLTLQLLRQAAGPQVS